MYDILISINFYQAFLKVYGMTFTLPRSLPEITFRKITGHQTLKGTFLTLNKSNMHLASRKFSVFLLCKFHYSKMWIQRCTPNIFNINRHYVQ
jgi:hypothetical protein